MGFITGELQMLISQFNATDDATMLGHTVPQLVESTAECYAEKTALICGKFELTFKSVNELANKYARCLLRHGIERGDIVGVALDRSTDLVVMLLAVLKVGAAYVPTDPDLPAQRIYQMMQNSSPKLVVTDANSLETMAFWQGACLTIDEARNEGGTETDSSNIKAEIGADDLAYIMYTSGSTGRPKGVEISHGAVCNVLLSITREPGCCEADRLLAISTISFDMAVTELFLPLINGATTIIAQRHEMRDAGALLRLMKRYSITMMQGTPAVWQMLLDSGWGNEPRLKNILSGGEALSYNLAEQLLARVDRLWNLYGATEATVYSTIWRVCPGEDITVGGPISNTQVYVLDENLSPVPLGCPGEVYTGGAGVGRGYHNNPILSNSRFLPSPFSKDLLYRTGDMARFLASGVLIMLGRADGQIKVRGYRVEAGDVETAITSHKHISAAVVTSHDNRLIAYCVRRMAGDDVQSEKMTETSLEHFLRPWLEARLPAYMVPAFFVELDIIPLTLNGKVDRKALPDPVEFVGVSASASPENELEGHIMAIWSRVLGHDRISIDANFFHIGGDSLRVIRMQVELEKLLGRPISSAKLFEHYTIKTLAAYISGTHETIRVPPATEPAAQRDAIATCNGNNEGIAIVSMACRLPGGVTTPEEYWALLESGRDATSNVPKDRWDAEALYSSDPNASGKSYCRRGGFLSLPATDSFDASFFNMTPREAQALDPAQRVLLETCWEGFERAGYTTAQLRGSRTGVFIGVSNVAAHSSSVYVRDLDTLDGYVTTGTAGGVMSGRVSYVLGLEGPSMTVDTACSSSLVTTHLACNALRQGECDLAVSGGVSLLLGPGLFVEFSRLRGMAEDGRCRAFAADAQGMGWGEGSAAIVLKRLSDAQRDGDIIHAVLRGTAVNHGGHGVSLTTPSGPAQQRLVRSALAASGLQPSDIDYIEAHGTATKLGDPIEGEALAEVFKGSRASGALEPLWIGSAKSNVGHTQAAAGLVGLLKVVLSMQHCKLPQSLHITKPTPEVDWKGADMSPVLKTRPWPFHGDNRPRRAGVSAFGIGGTNAHVVVEEAPRRQVAVPESPIPLPHELLFLMSAHDKMALCEQASKLHKHLSSDQGMKEKLCDVAFSLATTRTLFRQRLVLRASNRADLLNKLSSAACHPDELPVTTSSHLATPHLAMMFTGQGGHLLGMGRDLYDTYPVYRQCLDQIAAEFTQLLDRPLLDLLWASKTNIENVNLLKSTEFTQPALFSLQVSLWRLWQSWGVQPDFLLGHSVGELAVAHVAGILDLSDACRLVTTRGRLMQSLPVHGRMVSLEASASEVAVAIAALNLEAKVNIACRNTPMQTVASGNGEAIEAVEMHFRQLGRKTRQLGVSRAFHSHHVDDILDEFRAVAQSVQYHSSTLAIVSSLTGEVAQPGELEKPEYWVKQARMPVLFSDAMETLARKGVDVFLELGPEPVLCGIGAACLSNRASGIESTTWLPSLLPGKNGVSTIQKSLAELHTLKVPISWDGYFKPWGCQRIELPTYAFQGHQVWPKTVLCVDNTDITNTPSQGCVGVAEALEGAKVPINAEDLQKHRGLGLREVLSELTHVEQIKIILNMIRQTVAKTLGFESSGDVDADLPLKDIGIDSLAIALIRNQLTANGLPSADLSVYSPSLRVLAPSMLSQIQESHMPASTEDVLNISIDILSDISQCDSAIPPITHIEESDWVSVASASLEQAFPSGVTLNNPPHLLSSLLNFFNKIDWCSRLINDSSTSSDLIPGHGQVIPFIPPCSNPSSSEHDQFVDSTFSHNLDHNKPTICILSLFRPSDASHFYDPSRPIDRVTTLFGMGHRTSGHKGIVHGGLIATMLDESLGIVSQLNVALGKSGYSPTALYVTASLNIRYLAPLTTTETVVCVTAMIENMQGRNTALRAELTNSKGEIVAAAESLWVAVEPEQAAV